jgi:hypothetical protein
MPNYNCGMDPGPILIPLQRGLQRFRLMLKVVLLYMPEADTRSPAGICPDRKGVNMMCDVKDFEAISRYTRQQAVADGILLEVMRCKISDSLRLTFGVDLQGDPIGLSAVVILALVISPVDRYQRVAARRDTGVPDLRQAIFRVRVFDDVG